MVCSSEPSPPGYSGVMADSMFNGEGSVRVMLSEVETPVSSVTVNV